MTAKPKTEYKQKQNSKVGQQGEKTLLQPSNSEAVLHNRTRYTDDTGQDGMSARYEPTYGGVTDLSHLSYCGTEV